MGVEGIVKAALAAAGVTGGVGALALNKLIGAVQQYRVSKTFDEEGASMRKRLRGETKFHDDTRTEAMDAGGALVNRPATTQAPSTDLTQVNLPRDPRGGRKRTFDQMEQPAIEPADANVEMARFGGDGGGNTPSKETPIMMGADVSYGLQETHTTILPWNGWVSMVNVGAADTTIPPKLSIRMNAINDMIITPVATLIAGGTWANNVYNVPYNGFASTRDGINPAVFPRTLTAGASASETPFWLTYWKDIYEWYTVLGCEYKLTFNNTSALGNNNCSALILWDFDSYSDTAGSAGNQTPDTIVPELLSYKQMRKKAIGGTAANLTAETPYDVIQGRYKPGDIARNITNDGDVKTWTSTAGTTLPTLKDILNIRCAKSPFAMAKTTDAIGVNVQIELKYIVQFKDLKLNARYPNTLAGSATITQTLDNDAMDSV